MQAECNKLTAAFGRPGALDFVLSPLGGIVARLRQGASEATIALHGAHVLSWVHDGREMLWLSPVARLDEGKAVRGGIPVCWPWFGPHPGDAAKPAHGLVRTRGWHVAETAAAAGRTMLRLSIQTAEQDAQHWPHRAMVELTVALGDDLALTLATQNIGSAPFRLTEALHTYFRVGDIAQTTVEGLERCSYIDKLDGGARRDQAGAIGIDREVDRIYLGDTSALCLIDGGRGARVEIESVGSRSAVVWNPWEQKTARLGDMGSPDAYRQMLCIETANAGDDVVEVAPGATHRLQARFRVG